MKGGLQFAVGFVEGVTAAADAVVDGVGGGRGSFFAMGRARVAEGGGAALTAGGSLVTVGTGDGGGGSGMIDVAVIDGIAVCTALTGALGAGEPS